MTKIEFYLDSTMGLDLYKWPCMHRWNESVDLLSLPNIGTWLQNQWQFENHTLHPQDKRTQLTCCHVPVSNIWMLVSLISTKCYTAAVLYQFENIRIVVNSIFYPNFPITANSPANTIKYLQHNVSFIKEMYTKEQNCWVWHAQRRHSHEFQWNQ